MATTEINKGPIPNYSPGYAFYYISFVVVFSFFFLNIFVALIILTFQQEGEREIASCELDRNQVKKKTLSIFSLARMCLMFGEAVIFINVQRNIGFLFPPNPLGEPRFIRHILAKFLQSSLQIC